MKKFLIIILAVAVAGLVWFFKQVPKTDGPAGAGLPDSASVFSQVASRSTKAVIKADKGRVFAVRVENNHRYTLYFQLFNRTTNPVGASVPVVSIGIPPSSTTASSSATFDSSFFAPAIKFDAGITWAVSPNFGNYASTSDPDKSWVTVIYE